MDLRECSRNINKKCSRKSWEERHKTTKGKSFFLCISAMEITESLRDGEKGNENGSRRKSLLYKFSCKLVLFTNMMKTFYMYTHSSVLGVEHLQMHHIDEGFTILMSRSWVDLIKKFFFPSSFFLYK